jgi:chromosome segregation ATPase
MVFFQLLISSQFLPQDRVSAFAHLNPHDLLRETERAAGGMQLIEWHDSLIQDRMLEKDVLLKIKNDTEQLELLKARNADVEREVNRYLEREDIQRNIKVLEIAIPWIKYDHSIHLYEEAKEERKQLKEAIMAIRVTLEPARASIATEKDKGKEFEEKAKDFKKKFLASMGVMFF